MEDGKRASAWFRPWLALAGSLIGTLLGYLAGNEWPDAVAGAGVGFVLGGAAPLAAGIWQYLAVFFAAVGGFVWLMIHFIK